MTAHLAALTNDQLDARIARTLDAEQSALLDERARRVAAAYAARLEADAAWLAELDAEVAEAVAADRVLTVIITPAQHERLDALLPESMLGLQVLNTRVKGTSAQLTELLDWLDADTAVDIALPGFDCSTDDELAFAERAVRLSVAALRSKIRCKVLNA